MLLNILQCTGQPHCPNVKSAEVKKPWWRGIESSLHHLLYIKQLPSQDSVSVPIKWCLQKWIVKWAWIKCSFPSPCDPPLSSTYFPKKAKFPHTGFESPNGCFPFSLGYQKDEQIETLVLKQVTPRSPCSFLRKTNYVIAANGTYNACKVPRRNLCPQIVPTCCFVLLLKHRKEPAH